MSEVNLKKKLKKFPPDPIQVNIHRHHDFFAVRGEERGWMLDGQMNAEMKLSWVGLWMGSILFGLITKSGEDDMTWNGGCGGT